jgi:thiamine biosynthesis protein ThiS
MLKINGKVIEIEEGTTIAGFLAKHNLQPKSVVVELNRIIIDRDEYGEVVLNEGDEVEILRFIGGG